MRLIITYHDLAFEPLSPWCIAPDVFRQHLRMVKETGFELVSLDQILIEPRDSERRLCAVTFDDGRIGAFEYGAPILEEYGTRGTFYICPSFIDREDVPVEEQYSSFMTWSDIRALLARGHSIGSHGMSHARLSELSVEAICDELLESKKRLEMETGLPCKHFSAPHGDVTPKIPQMARALGYESVASIIASEGHATAADGCLPRYQVHQGEDFAKILHNAEVRESPSIQQGDFRIRFATDWDEPKVNQLFNQVFDRYRNLPEYRWKFKGSPWARERPVRSVVCERGDSLVGIHPIVSTKWQFYGKTLWSLHALDSGILDECGGREMRRAMHSLMSSAHSDAEGFDYGFAVGRALLTESESFGYRPLGSLTALVSDVDQVNVQGTDETLQVTLIERFGDEHDRWWESAGAKLFPVVIPRISAYLNWRFADHPFKKFRLIQLVGTGGILGYAVVGFAISEGGVAATVHDFLCPKEPAAIKSLIRACAEVARRHRAHRIQGWMFQHVPYYPIFEGSGFTPVKDAGIHFVISAPKNLEFENRCIASSQDWFVSIGDSDVLLF